MKISTRLLHASLALGVSLVFTSGLQPSVPPDLAFSPEEKMMFDMLKDFNEDQLAEVYNSIIEEVNKEAQKLPEDQRQQFLDSFWNEVTNEALKLDQKIKAYEEIEGKLPEPEVEKPVEKPVKPQPEVKPAPAKTPSAKVEAAVKLIDTLLTKLESLLRKTQIITDMPVRVQDWSKKRMLIGLPAQAQWADLKKQIETLVSKLYQLKEKDPKTKEFRHIDALIKSQTLYNALTQLQTVLSQKEPQIKTPELGAELTEASKKATLDTLNALTESLYKASLISLIDDVIRQYETRSKQLQEQEAQAIKDAQKGGGAVKVIPVTAAGQPPVSGGTAVKPDAARRGGGFPTDGGFDPFAGGPGSFRDPFASFGSDDGLSRNRGGSDKGGTTGGGGAAAGGAPVSAGDKPTSRKDDAQAKPDTKSKDEKKDEGKKPDITVKRLETLELQIDNIMDVLEDNQKLKRIDSYLLSPAEVDIALATKGLPDALSKARKASSNLRGIKRSLKSLSEKDQELYKKEANAIVKYYKKRLDSLINQIDEIENKENQLSGEKAYAFLGGKTLTTNVDLLRQVPNPVSLFELRDLIKEILKETDNDKR